MKKEEKNSEKANTDGELNDSVLSKGTLSDPFAFWAIVVATGLIAATLGAVVYRGMFDKSKSKIDELQATLMLQMDELKSLQRNLNQSEIVIAKLRSAVIQELPEIAGKWKSNDKDCLISKVDGMPAFDFKNENGQTDRGYFNTTSRLFEFAGWKETALYRRETNELYWLEKRIVWKKGT